VQQQQRPASAGTLIVHLRPPNQNEAFLNLVISPRHFDALASSSLRARRHPVRRTSLFSILDVTGRLIKIQLNARILCAILLVQEVADHIYPISVTNG
jgi:hypothetical protein